MSDWLAARNILAVRLDNIGDVIMLGPALRAIKETSPESRLTLLASPAGAQAAYLLPWVDDVITLRPVWQDVGGRIPFEPERERQLIYQLAERRFDAALIFTSFSQDPHAAGYLCYLAGIPLRAGESKEFAGSILSIELRGAPDEMHQVERNLRLVDHLGFRVRDRSLAVEIPAADHARADQLLIDFSLDPAAPFILLHPGASAQSRRYPPERSGELARLLVERGWPVLVTGTEREAALLAIVQQYAPDARYLVGQTSLGEYAALIERAALVICGNTLPLHLADALRTPVVALYSGTELDEQWRPRDTASRLLRRPTACHPCYRFECPIGLPCLDIPPAEVVTVGETLLAETHAGGKGDWRPAMIDHSHIRRIAVIRALHIGDLLLSVPALRSLRAGFPEAEITLIGLPWAATFARRFSRYVDRFVAFAGYPGIDEIGCNPDQVERFLAEQRHYGYDLVVQLHGSGRTSNALALDIGSPLTTGYYDPANPVRLTIDAPYPDDQHEIERNLNLASLLGCPDRGTQLEFPLADADRAEADALLAPVIASGRLCIGLHAGARSPARRWPVERFAAVADYVADRYQARVILTGGPGEDETVAAVAAAMTTQPVNLAGRTSLGGLAAVIDRLDLFISNDTGPAHIATALDTPSIRLIGPADHRRWAPLDTLRHPFVRRDVACNPCPYWECPIDHRCLRRIQPEAVIELVEQLLLRGAVACSA